MKNMILQFISQKSSMINLADFILQPSNFSLQKSKKHKCILANKINKNKNMKQLLNQINSKQIYFPTLIILLNTYKIQMNKLLNSNTKQSKLIGIHSLFHNNQILAANKKKIQYEKLQVYEKKINKLKTLLQQYNKENYNTQPLYCSRKQRNTDIFEQKTQNLKKNIFSQIQIGQSKGIDNRRSRAYSSIPAFAKDNSNQQIGMIKDKLQALEMKKKNIINKIDTITKIQYEMQGYTGFIGYATVKSKQLSKQAQITTHKLTQQIVQLLSIENIEPLQNLEHQCITINKIIAKIDELFIYLFDQEHNNTNKNEVTKQIKNENQLIQYTEQSSYGESITDINEAKKYNIDMIQELVKKCLRNIGKSIDFQQKQIHNFINQGIQSIIEWLGNKQLQTLQCNKDKLPIKQSIIKDLENKINKLSQRQVSLQKQIQCSEKKLQQLKKLQQNYEKTMKKNQKIEQSTQKLVQYLSNLQKELPKKYQFFSFSSTQQSSKYANLIQIPNKMKNWIEQRVLQLKKYQNKKLTVEESISYMKQQQKILLENIDHRNKQLEDLELIKRKYQNQIHQIQQTNIKLVADKQQRQNQIQSLDNLISVRRKNCEELEKKYQSLKKKKNSLKQKLDTLQQLVQKQQTQHQQLSNKIHKRQKYLKQIEQKMKDSLYEKQVIISQIQELQHQLTTLQSNKSQLNQNIRTANMNLSNIQIKLQPLNEQYLSKIQKMNKIENQYKDTSNLLDNKVKQVSALEKKYKDLKECIQKGLQQHRNISNQKEQIENVFEQLQMQFKNLMEDVTQLNTAKSDLDVTILELITKNEQLQSHHSKVSQQLNNIQQQIQLSSTQYQQLINDLTELKKDYEIVLVEKNQLEINNQQQYNLHEKLSHELKELIADLQENRQQQRNLLQRVKTLKEAQIMISLKGYWLYENKQHASEKTQINSQTIQSGNLFKAKAQQIIAKVQQYNSMSEKLSRQKLENKKLRKQLFKFQHNSSLNSSD